MKRGRVTPVSGCNPHHNQGAPEPVLSEVEVSLAFGDRGGNETDSDYFFGRRVARVPMSPDLPGALPLNEPQKPGMHPSLCRVPHGFGVPNE
jgi:hypothetical protein